MSELRKKYTYIFENLTIELNKINENQITLGKNELNLER